jgi:hypothetical protein
MHTRPKWLLSFQDNVFIVELAVDEKERISIIVTKALFLCVQ